ncbi:Major facilitator superfamily domain general substrate transporter [Penicillium chermesinum]|nr:Major facilitator superfamily domain general substrate transporter [Penicillium chermesinum]
MCFNIGVIIGPVLGGSLADPINSFPGIFGPGSWIGGENGVWWMKHWPFLLPNLLSAVFILMSFCTILFGLEETHEIARYRQDWGRDVGKRIARSFTRRPQHYHSLTVAGEEGLFVDERVEINSAPASPTGSPRPLPRPRQRPPFSQIFTRNCLQCADLCVPADSSRTRGLETDFFHFGGGLGLPSARVGLATAIIGFIGLPLQIFVYPRVQGKLGTLTSFRFFLPFSPLAYILMPFLVVLPRAAAIVWPSFSLVVGLQVLSRTFALPAAIILVNNSVTDSSILGTVHGVARVSRVRPVLWGRCLVVGVLDWACLIILWVRSGGPWLQRLSWGMLFCGPFERARG